MCRNARPCRSLRKDAAPCIKWPRPDSNREPSDYESAGIARDFSNENDLPAPRAAESEAHLSGMRKGAEVCRGVQRGAGIRGRGDAVDGAERDCADLSRGGNDLGDVGLGEPSALGGASEPPSSRDAA
ncbi:MAG: hypothetical protein AMXMBFR58_06170 [Phycisphaerae bacterium]